MTTNILYLEDGGTRLLRNVCKISSKLHCMMSQDTAMFIATAVTA